MPIYAAALLVFWGARAPAQVSGDSRLLLEPGPTSVEDESVPDRYRVRRPRPSPARQPKAVAPPEAVRVELVHAPNSAPAGAGIPSAAEIPPDAEITPAPRALAKDEEAFGIKLGFAPAWMSVRSTSDYAFRRLASYAPGAALDFELSPRADLVFNLNYFTSLAAAVPDGAAGEAGLEVQKIGLGVSRRVPARGARLGYGLRLVEFRERLSRDAATHVGFKTVGLGLDVGAEIPAGPAYAHAFAFGFEPLLSTTEDGGDLGVRSGRTRETVALSGAIGGAWTPRPGPPRGNHEALFWRIESRVERTRYGGEASRPDGPGPAPRDVVATTALNIVYLGFSWGP